MNTVRHLSTENGFTAHFRRLDKPMGIVFWHPFLFLPIQFFPSTPWKFFFCGRGHAQNAFPNLPGTDSLLPQCDRSGSVAADIPWKLLSSYFNQANVVTMLARTMVSDRAGKR